MQFNSYELQFPHLQKGEENAFFHMIAVNIKCFVHNTLGISLKCIM